MQDIHKVDLKDVAWVLVLEKEVPAAIKNFIYQAGVN